MEVQTRSEDGSLKMWPTIAAAFAEADRDPDIWKISWTDKETNERVRMVRRTALTYGVFKNLVKAKNDVWIYEPIVFPVIDEAETDEPRDAWAYNLRKAKREDVD